MIILCHCAFFFFACRELWQLYGSFEIGHLNDKAYSHWGNATAPFNFVYFKSKVFHRLRLNEWESGLGCVLYCLSMHYCCDKRLCAWWLQSTVNSQSWHCFTQPDFIQGFFTFLHGLMKLYRIHTIRMA